MTSSNTTLQSVDRNNHVGQILLNALRENPDNINQIDGYTGEQESNASVLDRSTRLATSFRKYGLVPGDVVALAGRNHIDVHIPYYAAMYNGLPLVGVDPLFKFEEIRALFSITRPKLIFCQSDILDYMVAASKELELNAKIVTFDGQYKLADFMHEYQDDNVTADNFEVENVDVKTAYCWLVSTSGTTGVPKTAAFTHYTVADTLYFYKSLAALSAASTKGVSLNLSPQQWLSSYIIVMATVCLQSVKVQTSGPSTTAHIVEIINKYKPTTAFFSPVIMSQILSFGDACDLSSLKIITLGGALVHKEILLEVKAKTKGKVQIGYGQTETMGPVFLPWPDSPLESMGKTHSRFKVMLVDPETDQPIDEPNKSGELLVKGPGFTEYYNNPEETVNCFTKDGWVRTGDLFYKDENDNYFFVDRLKMLIKCRNYHIIPPELEDAIRCHEGVHDVVVVGLHDKEFWEVPVACVQRTAASTVTAQQIKDIIANKFSDIKRLRGGVVFVDELPMTSTGKIARNKLKEFVKTAHRE